MKLRKLVTLGGITLGVLGLGMAVKSLMPQQFATFPLQDTGDEVKESTPLDTSTFPAVEVSFLRCGSVAIPELVAVPPVLATTIFPVIAPFGTVAVT